MNLEQIRLNVENFSVEISKEYYLQGAGLSTEVNFDKIYRKYQHLFNSNNLLQIKSELLNAVPDSDAQRKLKVFLEAFHGGIISEINKDLNIKFFRSEVGSKIEVEQGKRIPYRSSMIYMFNEFSREKRETAGVAIEAFVSTALNPILEEIYEREQEYINGQGFENKIEMFSNFSGIDIYEVDKMMQNFLKETEDAYVEYLKKLAKDKLGLSINDLRRHDLMHITRTSEFDTLFPKDNMFGIVEGFIKRMGIDISAGENIKFDLEARDNKSPRAFCSPVRIPGEVYLVIYPRGGEEDYTAFMHELGHALHFANINSNLDFEYKCYGDNSVTEGYAMTFDHLTMKESWINRNLNVNSKNIKEYFMHRAMNELIMLRRYAAKVHYEIKLNETKGLQGKKELYAETFENATKVKYSPDYYLLDVDQYFYCVRYLRAWMFQANMHEYLNNNYGSEWFENKNAGEFFMNMWSMGQKYNADELSDMNGGYKLSTSPLLSDINSILLN